jgi:alkylation response protein AidB-like acyl-CoA dehydrogenase
MDLPPRLGGGGASTAQMADLFRRCGQIDVELRDVVGGGHARLLMLDGSRRFDLLLRAVANSGAYCGVAITEDEVGSDLHALRTEAVANQSGYTINGMKRHVSRIEEATHFIVFATVRRSPDAKLITAFVVPRDAPGVSIERATPLGMSGVSWGRIYLRGVEVARRDRVGGEGQAIRLFVHHFSYWRIMMAATAIGGAQAAIDRAIERLKSRDAFGGPIGRFTHLQQALAEHVARLRMAWLLIENVAIEFDKRRWPIFDAAMVKAEALEIALAATDWAMRVMAASGYETPNPIEKTYRDLLGLRIADGTTDVLRGQVARAILGEHLYELALGRTEAGTYGGEDARRSFW